MNNGVVLQPAYVLHRRSYRETSFLVDIFSQDYGRLTLVAKGAKKKHVTPGLLQPFIPLYISWTGKNELVTMTQVENRGQAKLLFGECLFAGFYLNELMMALLEKWDAHTALFAVYEKTLHYLNQGLEEKYLRSFEKCLIEEIGYGLLPKSKNALDAMILKEKSYRFVFEQGFTSVDDLFADNVFSGKSLLAIANEDWQDSQILQDAKRLMRLILMPLLGNRTIYSRKLFGAIK